MVKKFEFATSKEIQYEIQRLDLVVLKNLKDSLEAMYLKKSKTRVMKLMEFG
jgi:hypothetical protein